MTSEQIMTEGKSLAAKLCLQFDQDKVDPVIGTVALAFLLGASAACTEEPKATLENSTELSRMIMEQKLRQDRKAH